MGGSERAAEYVITGRVQGVGFRWWCVQTARRLGVRGTVRNRADGAVEVRASGDEESMREFARQLANGPPGARVDDVEQTIIEAHDLPRGFEIVH